MKKAIILGIIFALSFGTTLMASQLYDAYLTSDGHKTYSINAMNIEGGYTLDINTATVTFEPIDDNTALYDTCETECFEETVVFETNDYFEITHHLIVSIADTPTDKFDVNFKVNNSTSDTLQLGLGETTVTIKIWLTEELTLDEMGEDVKVELGFEIK